MGVGTDGEIVIFSPLGSMSLGVREASPIVDCRTRDRSRADDSSMFTALREGEDAAPRAYTKSAGSVLRMSAKGNAAARCTRSKFLALRMPSRVCAAWP